VTEETINIPDVHPGRKFLHPWISHRADTLY